MSQLYASSNTNHPDGNAPRNPDAKPARLIRLAKNILFLTFCFAVIGVLFGSVGAMAFRTRQEPPKQFSPQLTKRLNTDPTVLQVNAAFADLWKEKEVHPTPAADNLTLARRISLGLTGTIPSLEEIRQLEQVPEDQQLAWWTEHVLADRRYADFVGERMARMFVGAEDGPFLVYRRRRFVLWLSDQLAENRPYDQIVRDLVAGDGLWTTSPEVNFITVTQSPDDNQGPDPIRLAARTSRAFLALRIDCLQCHDDKLGNTEIGSDAEPRYGLQTDFHKFAAFFGDVSSSAVGVWDPKDRPAYAVELLGDTEETELEPAVPFSPELLPKNGSKRDQLAVWLTHKENKQFARTMVNRMWALLFGQPMQEPIDDIPLFGDRPTGMDILADDFIAHNYDIKRLIRMIVFSEPFRRDCQAKFEIAFAHEHAWASFPVTRLRPEQAAGGLIQASNVKTIDADAHVLTRIIRYFQEREFVDRYGDMGEDEFTDRGGTIPQRLLMLNGNLVDERIEGNNGMFNAISQIGMLSSSDEAAVEHAYLCVLTRRPTERESAAMIENFLEGRKGQYRAQGVEDIYWVLLNSSEFSWNH